MPLVCPNINNNDWKAIVDSYGEVEAYKIFAANNFDIPTLDYAAEIHKSLVDNEIEITPFNLIQISKTKKLTGVKYYEQLFHIKNREGQYKRFNNTIENFQKLNVEVSKINDQLKGSGYKAQTSKQFWNNSEKLIIRIIPDPSFRQTNQPVKVNNELNSKIKEWLSKLGIQIKYYESLKEKFGNDPVAVADFLEKTILVSQNTEDGLTLPEETIHFAIELLGDNNPYVRRLLELIPETEQYKAVKETYAGTYITETQFRKEAIGKLGAEILLQRNTLSVPVSNDIISVLKKLWQQFLDFFKNGNAKEFRKEIDYILGKISDNIISGDITNYNVDNLPDDKMFKLTEDIKNEQKVLRSAIDNTFTRLRNVIAKGDQVLSTDQKLLLDKLKRQLEKDQYRLGLYNFVASARIEAKDIKEEFNNLSDNDDLNNVVKTLNKISKYLNSYLPVLEDINSTLQNEEVDSSILKKVNETIADISQLQKRYINAAKPIITKVLQPYAVKTDGTSINIKSALDLLEKDISFTQRWLDAAAEVDDDILQVTDKLVKEHKEQARLESLNDQKDIINAKLELEKVGVLTATWVYETNSKGEVTGYYLNRHNTGDYENAKREFYEDLRKKYNLQPGQKPEVGTRERQQWASEIRKWHDENTVVKENVREIIDNKKKEIFDNASTKTEAERQWNDWTATNIGFYFNNQGIESTYYRGELVEPNDKYLSQSWLDIYTKEGKVRDNEQAKAKDKFFKLILEKDRKANSKLHERLKKPDNLVPQMRKDTIERLKSANSIKSFVENELKETFLRNEDDLDFGLKVTDENGIPLSFIPNYYTRKLKDTKLLSTDITTAMSAFNYMANNFESMNKIVDLLELESDVLRERKVGTGQYALLSMFSKKEPVVKKGEATYAFQRFQDYIKMVVYGEQKVDEKTLFGTQLDKAKTIDAFGRYVSINGLALNVYSGISNITYGSAMTRTEGIAKEYFTNKDLLWADKTYTSNTAGILANVGTRLNQNKLSLYIEHMNVLQDFEENIREIDGERKTKFGQLANSSALFILNKAGEHWMQTRTSLALANTVKLKDREGNIKNLYDSFFIRDNRLELEEGLTIVADGKTFKAYDEGRPFTQKELIRIINKQNFINKRLHGIYNRIDKSAIQKYALGRLAVMFRKFMKPGWNRRFAKLQYNYEGEAYTEGYYYTAGKFMFELIKDLRKLQFKLGSHWNELEEFEKRNMYRMLAETGYFIAAATLVAVVTNIKGDDDDWQLAMMAYQANRLYSELRFYSEPNEFFKIMGSPAAGIDQAQRIINFTRFWNWTDEIQNGRFKGYSRFEKGLIDIVPFAATANKFLSPDEQLKYFAK